MTCLALDISFFPLQTFCLATFIDEYGHDVNYSVALPAPADPQFVVPSREFRVPSVRDDLDTLQEHHTRTSIAQTRAFHQSEMTWALWQTRHTQEESRIRTSASLRRIP